MTVQKKPKKSSNRKIAFRGSLYLAISIAVVAAAAASFGAISAKAAAMVNGRFIPLAEYRRNVERFFAASSSGAGISLIPTGVSREVIEENVMERMVSDELLKQEAEKDGITVEAADLEATLAMVKNNPPDAAAMDRINAALGWSQDEFMCTVLRPYALRRRLEARIGSAETDRRMEVARREAIIWRFVR